MGLTAAKMHVSEIDQYKRRDLGKPSQRTIIPTDRLQDVGFGIHPYKDEYDHDTHDDCAWYDGDIRLGLSALKV